MEVNKDILGDKSINFAIKSVKLCRELMEVKKEYIISKQLLKSATSIGANIREAKYAESKNNFIHKLKIELKESNETEYWLIILYESELISKLEYDVFLAENKELLRLLISSINTTKKKLLINLFIVLTIIISCSLFIVN